MKAIAFLSAVFLIGGSFGAEPLDAEELKTIEREGGLCEKTLGGAVVRVVNAQRRVDSAVVKSATYPVKGELGVPLAFETAASAPSLTSVKTGAVIAVVDDPALPSLLVAPESRYAAINVAALSADGPDSERLRVRLEKEMTRATGYLLGAAQSAFQPCVMRTISSLEELDRLRNGMPHPETQNKIFDGSRQLGVGRHVVATYADACAAGWASAPTNDVQKAIWDKVHAIPKNPMKIEFDPKKGR